MRLEDALGLRVSGRDVIDARLNGTQVWPVGTPAVPITLGDTGSGGQGNWPTSSDRALLHPFLLATPMTLLRFCMRTRPEHGGGVRFKGVIYLADHASISVGGIVAPRTRAAVTAASAVTPAGQQVVTIDIEGALNPGWIWIGYTADGSGTNPGGMTDSGGQVSPNRTIMFNTTLSFANPQNPAPDFPGSPTYTNVPSVWLEGTTP